MHLEVRRVCQAVCEGELEVATAAVRLKEFAKGARREDVSLAVSCTLFALWDLCSEGDDTRHQRLASLAQSLCQNGALDEDVWLSTAEWDLLEASQTVSNVVDDKRREVRFYTRVVYVQTRFNLLSESPTGFARLFSLLQRMTLKQVEPVRRDLCRLVGELKIEPHRVLDALLEFLPPSQHPSHQLLSLFDPQKTAHLLGRKLRQVPVQETPSPGELDVERRPEKLPRTTRTGKGEDLRAAKDLASSKTAEKRIPRRYFRLCAALEVAGYLDASVVFRYLSPTLRETRERTNAFVSNLRETAKEQRFPNLNRKAPEERTRMTEKDKDVPSVYRDPKKFSYQPQTVLQLEASAPTILDPFPRLAAGFLETSQPGKALRILRAMGDVFCPEVTEGCLGVVEKLIDPFFRRFPSSARSMERFVEEVKSPLFPSLRSAAPVVFEWLTVTGCRLHRLLELFRKTALVMMHELRFYGHASYASSLIPYPSPKPRSAEATISTAFLPSLLLMDQKMGLEASAWIDGLIKLCSYSVRVMVGIHFEEVVAKSALLDRCAAMAETAARHLVKTLVTAPNSETFERNVIPIVDSLGKISILAPYTVTRVMVQKVQTDVIAAQDLSTAMLFFTPLSFGAFSHHIVVAMISTGADRKHVDGHITQWYKNLLTFLGRVAHDYPEMLSLHFIIQNILKEISNTEVIHTHVLRELVHSMTGFQHCSDIGNNQFATLSGGPMLKSIGLVTAWQKDEAGYNASAVALKRTLALPPRNERCREAERKLTLGGHMFVLLMKFLDYIPIRGDFAEVASIMEVHSVVHGTFLAFMEFLSVYCTTQEYSEMLPPVGYVLNGLRLPMHYAVHLYRPSIAELRVVQRNVDRLPAPPTDAAQLHLQQLLVKLQALTRDDTAQEDGQKRTWTKVLERSGLTSLDGFLYQSQKVNPQLCLTRGGVEYGVASVRSFYDFVEDVRQNEQFQGKGVWEVMSPEFYVFFWSFKLNDITVSDTLYKKQTAQIQEELSSQEHEIRSETALQSLEHKLSAIKVEHELQGSHVKFCRAFIRTRQEHLLAHVPTEKLRSFVDAFLQLCLYPRIRLGHEDALFAFEFVLLMTKTGAKNFPTLFILDKVVKELFPCLICMTDNEAEGFANFMYEFLRQMERWRSNKALFSKEFGRMPGALEDPFTPGATELVTHSNFLKVMAKWSNVIARLLKECLQPPEVEEKGKEEVDPVKHRKIMRRPALLVLVRLIPIFPTLTGLAKHLRAALVYVIEHDRDEGMKTSANAALSRLDQEMESQRPGRWLELDAYNIPTKEPETPVQSHGGPTMEMDSVKVGEMTQEPLLESRGYPHEMEEVEEGLLAVGSHKEEGELGKGTRRPRGRKVDETSHRTSARKRTATAPKAEEAPTGSEALRKGHVREEVKRKRETPNARTDSDKEQRRTKGNRREETRRKA